MNNIKKVEELFKLKSNLEAEVGKVIIGQKEIINQLFIALLCKGHVMLEGVPGLAKTLLINTLSDAMKLNFSRIQFTPDLMPSDITGTEILEEDSTTGKRVFKFFKGPIFGNIVLADEINRTPPKTQASLLEAMQEHKVTVNGKTYTLEEPFFVLATQNPVDYEGTFPLPESQMDRFLMRLQMGYPSVANELEILSAESSSYNNLEFENPVPQEEIVKIQETVSQVFVEQTILEYILDIITATRTESEFKAGISVRGSLALKKASQARALYFGRDFVIPSDVSSICSAVLSHRLNLRRPSSDALEERRLVEGIVTRILAVVPQPN